MTVEEALARFQAKLGQELGCSSWRLIDQGMIDTFATLTDDPQYIHIDPVRAKDSPFGGTIAHGFLTLSMLSSLAREALTILEGRKTGVNYGFERVRFVSPVRSGARIRGRFTLASVEHRRGTELALRYGVTVEIEGQDKPALTAEWLSLALY